MVRLLPVTVPQPLQLWPTEEHRHPGGWAQTGWSTPRLFNETLLGAPVGPTSHRNGILLEDLVVWQKWALLASERRPEETAGMYLKAVQLQVESVGVSEQHHRVSAV